MVTVRRRRFDQTRRVQVQARLRIREKLPDVTQIVVEIGQLRGEVDVVFPNVLLNSERSHSVHKNTCVLSISLIGLEACVESLSPGMNASDTCVAVRHLRGHLSSNTERGHLRVALESAR